MKTKIISLILIALMIWANETYGQIGLEFGGYDSGGFDPGIYTAATIKKVDRNFGGQLKYRNYLMRHHIELGGVLRMGKLDFNAGLSYSKKLKPIVGLQKSFDVDLFLVSVNLETMFDVTFFGVGVNYTL